MQYLGDILEDATIRFRFNTRTTAGVPINGASLAAEVYKDGSATQIASGVTLTVPFDSITGLALCVVDTSASADYTPGSDYSVVLSAGTVDGVSVVGVRIAEFSIENRNTKANVTQVAGQTASASGPVTFPATIASTTNITAASGVTLAANAITDAIVDLSALQEIADFVLSRNVSNVEATAGEHTLCTAILAMLENSISGTTLTIKRTDGTTTHYTKTLTKDAGAEPITGIN
jgi:hypothetical protein